MPDDTGEPPLGLRLRFPASPWQVRAALEHLLQRLPMSDRDPDLPGVLEIVMAEVLNNIVEHAYRGGEGMIELQVRAEPRGVRCLVTDFGYPLEPGQLPEGRLPVAGADELPEGGFGWYLILSLAQDVVYRRSGSSNRLSLLVPGR